MRIPCGRSARWVGPAERPPAGGAGDGVGAVEAEREGEDAARLPRWVGEPFDGVNPL